MSDERITFKRIKITRMPGFQDGGFEIADLCPGINIVHGPNASGKTTTACAIHSLLWPKDAASSGAILEGDLDVGGSETVIHYEFRQTDCDGTMPVVGPASDRDRYYLALHDLLKADAKNFADEVMLEARGGYNMSQASRDLDYSDGVSRPGAIIQSLKTARESVTEAEDKHQKLMRDESRLTELQNEKTAAEEADAEAKLVEKVLDYTTARRELERSADELSEFPEELALLKGDERERLEEIESILSDSAEKLKSARQAVHSFVDIKQGCDLPLGGVGKHDIETFEAACQELAVLERDINEQERIAVSSQSLADDALRNIGKPVDAEVLKDINLDGIHELSVFARDGQKVRSDTAAKSAMEGWLSGASPNEAEAANLQSGIDLLNRWLRTPGKVQSQRIWIGVLAGLMAGAGIALAAFLNVLFGLVLLAGGAVALFFMKTGSTIDQRDAYRKDFESLELGMPREWSSDEVSRLVGKLNARMAEVALAREKEQRRKALENQYASLEKEKADILTRREDLLKRLGVALSREDLERECEAELFYLAQNIVRWQTESSNASAASAELERLNGNYGVRIEWINSQFHPYGYPPVRSSAEALKYLENLKERKRRYESAVESAREKLDLIKTLKIEIARLRQKKWNLFNSIGLQTEDTVKLDTLLAQLEVYTAAKKKHESNEALLEQKKKVVEDHPELTSRSLEDLEEELRHLTEQASRVSQIDQEIGGIVRAIEEAKRGHTLESAQADLDKCLDDLSAERERKAASSVGWTLVNFLEAKCIESDLPDVFVRARELFATVTRGRYRLELDREGCSFSAYDTLDSRRRSLNELSSGTRIQLLLSVRLAFVETREHGGKLPLLLDETLADSDDTRARGIIEAVIEICKTGRQVFYFTCKDEECDKWLALTGDYPDLPCKVVAIGRQEVEPIPIQLKKREPVPEPGDLSHDDYGRLLEVPPFPLGSDGIARAHLWYVVDDNRALKAVLDMGIETWGPLKTVLDHTGELSVLDPSICGRTLATAKLLEEANRLYRCGRGKPLDNAALLESRIMSTPSFREQITAITESVAWDAGKLIEALEQGKVKRLQRTSVQNLRSWLLDHGYLSDQEPFEPEETCAITEAYAADDISAGKITQADVREALKRIGLR